MLFRKKQLDNDSALFTPIQFEFITWIEFVIVILLAQVFYLRNKRLAEEKATIGAELSVATQIQADMLPRIFPAFPERKEFDLYATMTPAKEVGEISMISF